MRERPNRDALNRAVDIFRDALRRFVVGHVKRVRGVRVEDEIRRSLQGNRGDSFEQNLRDGRNVEESIDVNDFPYIVKRLWREVFNDAFNGKLAVQNELWQIKDARNDAAHPREQDIDSEYVRARLYDITVVLGRIGAEEGKQEVEGIRDGLVEGGKDSESPGPGGLPQRPTPGGGYWVYEDRPTSRARVHEGTCRWCNHGEGMGRGRIAADNEWYGPFGSREEAFRRARATGQRDVRGCGVCRP